VMVFPFGSPFIYFPMVSLKQSFPCWARSVIAVPVNIFEPDDKSNRVSGVLATLFSRSAYPYPLDKSIFQFSAMMTAPENWSRFVISDKRLSTRDIPEVWPDKSKIKNNERVISVINIFKRKMLTNTFHAGRTNTFEFDRQKAFSRKLLLVIICCKQ
jgi:hypothetical protein